MLMILFQHQTTRQGYIFTMGPFPQSFVFYPELRFKLNGSYFQQLTRYGTVPVPYRRVVPKILKLKNISWFVTLTLIIA
jgi:hypothetical protein